MFVACLVVEEVIIVLEQVVELGLLVYLLGTDDQFLRNRDDSPVGRNVFGGRSPDATIDDRGYQD